MENGESICERELLGMKLFKPLSGLLDRFRALHPHHNRLLFYDDYITLLLLSYFNPLMSTLRAIQRTSDFPSVQKRLGIRRASLGEPARKPHTCFDPAPLRGFVRSTD